MGVAVSGRGKMVPAAGATRRRSGSQYFLDTRCPDSDADGRLTKRLTIAGVLATGVVVSRYRRLRNVIVIVMGMGVGREGDRLMITSQCCIGLQGAGKGQDRQHEDCRQPAPTVNAHDHTLAERPPGRKVGTMSGAILPDTVGQLSPFLPCLHRAQARRWSISPFTGWYCRERHQEARVLPYAPPISIR